MELIIQHLTKTYPGGVTALEDVSLTIPTGVFGLLGPNGAGKSTLIRILATLQEADSGTVFLDGIDVLNEKAKVRARLGYLPQDFDFYPKMRAWALLDHLAHLNGLIDRRRRADVVEALLRRVNLWDVRKRRVGSFSGGMKQRLGIAQALLGEPQLIIVDEPTAGLDPMERRRFHDLLSEIGEEVIVLLSTHIVEDVTHICTQMAIIDGGRILSAGSPQAAVQSMQGHIWEKTVTKAEVPDYEAAHYVVSSRLLAGQTVLRVFSTSRPDASFEEARATLEDFYFHTLSEHRLLTI